jgi:hypothetical protein
MCEKAPLGGLVSKRRLKTKSWKRLQQKREPDCRRKSPLIAQVGHKPSAGAKSNFKSKPEGHKNWQLRRSRPYRLNYSPNRQPKRKNYAGLK